MDLNLLRVFVAIAETGSLTDAAARLYVTQPAVSQSLGRLRRELDDPLFVREGRRMVPTPLAESVYPGFREAIGIVDRTLDTVHGFDPADSDRVLRIALSELGEIGWLPAIAHEVRRAAPRMRIEVVPMDVAALPEWLARGVVDLAITPSVVPGRFVSEHVKSQPYALAMSQRHPLAEARLGADDLATAAQARVTTDSGSDLVDAALARAGIPLEPRITLTQFASLPPLLSSDRELVAILPDVIAEGWRHQWPLVVRPLPFRLDPVEVRLYRRATTQHAAALDWMFETVARAVRGSTGRFQVIQGGERA